MQYAVDASVAAKWFIPASHKENAERLLSGFLEDGVKLMAPDLLVVELANLLWVRSTLRGDISEIQAARAYESFLALGLDLWPSTTVAAAALKLAAEGKHKVYDMMYVALARREGCQLITADAKLINKLGAKFPFVRWIGDFWSEG
jgi:predicted nucleic acid-binding protein